MQRVLIISLMYGLIFGLALNTWFNTEWIKDQIVLIHTNQTPLIENQFLIAQKIEKVHPYEKKKLRSYMHNITVFNEDGS